MIPIWKKTTIVDCYTAFFHVFKAICVAVFPHSVALYYLIIAQQIHSTRPHSFPHPHTTNLHMFDASSTATAASAATAKKKKTHRQATFDGYTVCICFESTTLIVCQAMQNKQKQPPVTINQFGARLKNSISFAMEFHSQFHFRSVERVFFLFSSSLHFVDAHRLSGSGKVYRKPPIHLNTFAYGQQHQVNWLGIGRVRKIKEKKSKLKCAEKWCRETTPSLCEIKINDLFQFRCLFLCGRISSQPEFEFTWDNELKANANWFGNMWHMFEVRTFLVCASWFNDSPLTMR